MIDPHSDGNPVVWLVESGDYEQRGVDLVAVSVEAAVAAIKATFAPPFIVRWSELVKDDDEWTLRGDFEAVIGYSTRHQARFDIRPTTLVGGNQPPSGVRGDPAAPRTVNADARDPTSSSPPPPVPEASNLSALSREWHQRARQADRKRTHWLDMGDGPMAATHHARREVYHACADQLDAAIATATSPIPEAPAPQEPEGDEPHTGDDSLLDALTDARVALEEVEENDEASVQDAIADALEALTRADAIRVAELKAPAAPQEPRWQPIETAPKDGRVFLSYWRDTPQFVAWVSGEGFRVLMPPARGMGFGVHGNFKPFNPTHWMPLPLPPETGSA